jgi:RNA polymerase primary sigma factor
VGQRTPPRRARGRPLYPIEALSPLDEAQTKELVAGVERAVAALPPKEAQVIRRRFEASVETPQTLNEIGAVFGLTGERIRQLEAAALSGLARGWRANSRNRVIDA